MACEAIEEQNAQKSAALKLASNGASFRLARKDGDKEDWTYTPSVYDIPSNAYRHRQNRFSNRRRKIEETFAGILIQHLPIILHRRQKNVIFRLERLDR